MTIECVDGQMATPHITGAQKGAIHAGVFGSGSYVLATGNQCKATQNSATSVTVGTGDLIIHGRHHQIVSAETVTIQSGTQGQKRNDLICVVYHRDAQGIEQPTVTVLKGTPTTGTPADPTVPTGNVLNGDAVDYFPLYRVSLNGTTASAPVRLFKVSPTLASLGDSVSRAAAVTDWVYLYGSESGQKVKYRRNGNMAELYFNYTQESINRWNAGNIPEPLRPHPGVSGACMRCDKNGAPTNNVATYEVWSNGNVYFTTPSAEIGGIVSGYCCWPIS